MNDLDDEVVVHREPIDGVDRSGAPPAATKPKAGHRPRMLALRIGNEIRRRPIWIALPIFIYAAIIVSDALNLFDAIDPRIVKENAGIYAQVIPTLLIALMVETVWLLRSGETYFTESELEQAPDARKAIDALIVVMLLIGFLISAQGEIAALGALSRNAADIDKPMADAPIRAICLQLFLLCVAFLARLTLVRRDTVDGPGT